MLLDCLWLLLLLAGLGLLALAIWGIEKMSLRMKQRDDAARAAAQDIADEVAIAEEDFLRVQNAREYLENTKHESTPDGSVPQEFSDAMDNLTASDVLEIMARKAFGTDQTVDLVTANQSAFATKRPVQHTVMGKGKSVAPIKSRENRDGVSKAERKIYKKLKQGA